MFSCLVALSSVGGGSSCSSSVKQHICKSASVHKLQPEEGEGSVGPTFRYKRASFTSITALNYKYRSDYVRDSLTALNNMSNKQRQNNSSSSNDKLQLPDVSCRRYSLPTNELIEEYKLRRNSQRDRSGSIGASIMNLLRPNRSREGSRRNSTANMRTSPSSNNLQIPRTSSIHRRRNSVGSWVGGDCRRSSLIGSLLDVCSGGGAGAGATGGVHMKGQLEGGAKGGIGSRKSSVADFMDCIMTSTSRRGSIEPLNSSATGGQTDRGAAAGEKGQGSTWFHSLVISQQDREENHRKVGQIH